MPPTPRLLARYNPTSQTQVLSAGKAEGSSALAKEKVDGPNAGAVAGGVTLTLVVLFILVVVIVPCVRKRQRKKVTGTSSGNTSPVDQVRSRLDRSFFGHRRTPPLAPILDRRGFGPEPEPAKPSTPLRQLRLQPKSDKYYENRAQQSPAQPTTTPRSGKQMEERRRSMAGNGDDYYGEGDKPENALATVEETSPITAYIAHLNSLAPPATGLSYATGASYGSRSGGHSGQLRNRTGGSVLGSGSSSSSLDSDYSQSSAELSDSDHHLAAQHYGRKPHSAQRVSFAERQPHSPKQVGKLLQNRFRLASPKLSPAVISPEEQSTTPSKPRKRVRLPAPLELVPEAHSPYGTGYPSPYLQSGAPRSARRRSALRYSGIPASALPYGHPHSGIPASALPYGNYPMSGIPHSGIPPSALPYGYPYSGVHHTGGLHSGFPGSAFHHSGIAHSGLHSGFPHSAAPNSAFPYGVPHNALPFSAAPFSAAPHSGVPPHSAAPPASALAAPKSAAGFPLPASPLPAAISPLSPSDAVVVTPNPYQTSFDVPPPPRGVEPKP